MITFKDIQRIIKDVTHSTSIFDSLHHHRVSPLEFFTYLNNDPQAKAEFELARQIASEQVLAESIQGIDACQTEFDIKKQTLKVRTSQWLAEKLAPDTYGTRVDINVNKTINIKGVLEEARKRVFIPSQVVESVIDGVNNPAKLLSHEADSDESYLDILGDNVIR